MAQAAAARIPELVDTGCAPRSGRPLRLIHVVRNPFDNVAAISRWHRLSLDREHRVSISRTARPQGALNRMADDAEVLTVHHEAFIRAPAPTLSAVCEFLGLAADDSISLPAAALSSAGRRTRASASRGRPSSWPKSIVGVSVIRSWRRTNRSDAEPDDAAAVTSSNAGRESGSHSDSRRGPSALDRVGAFLNPRVRV